MALYLQTYGVAAAGGNREGLTDTVADLFADDTPLFSMSKKVQAISTKHEWLVDNLATASRTAVVEGASITMVKPGTRTRRMNYTLIRLRNWEISNTQLAVATAGIKDQVARELMKALKALATDYEKAILSTSTTAIGTSTVGRQLMGLQKAIATNTEKGTGTGNTGISILTEDNVNLLMQKIWNAGGNPRAIICGGYQKRVISKKFSAKTGFTFNVEASTRTAIANINKYEGSFGTCDIIPDRLSMANRIAVITPEQIKIAVLRDITQYKAPESASRVGGWVEAEMTLEFGNEKGHARNSYLRSGGAIA
jgi:hypothetical protein